MWFMLVGLVLLAMKLGEFGPGANWSWLWVLTPFALAILWWSFADGFGLTQAKAMRKMDDRRAERRTRAMEALGIDARRERKVNKARELARRANPDAPRAPLGTNMNPDTVAPEPPRQEPRL